MKTLSLEGKTALVTGSSKGIGAGIAAGIEEAGARVIRHGSRPESLGLPAGQPGIAKDLSTPAGAIELIDEAFAFDPALSLLVANAGSFFDCPFLEMDEERWQRTMALNLTGTFFLLQAFAKKLAGAYRHGAVVIVSSTNGFQAEAGSVAYDTSKGGLIMMMRSLATELADYGIRVNGLAPGLIRTPLTGTWMDQKSDVVAHYERKILLGRIGSLEDCAGAAVFLLSDAASYITGHLLVVDGGLTVSQIGKM